MLSKSAHGHSFILINRFVKLYAAKFLFRDWHPLAPITLFRQVANMLWDLVRYSLRVSCCWPRKILTPRSFVGFPEYRKNITVVEDFSFVFPIIPNVGFESKLQKSCSILYLYLGREGQLKLGYRGCWNLSFRRSIFSRYEEHGDERMAGGTLANGIGIFRELNGLQLVSLDLISPASLYTAEEVNRGSKTQFNLPSHKPWIACANDR